MNRLPEIKGRPYKERNSKRNEATVYQLAAMRGGKTELFCKFKVDPHNVYNWVSKTEVVWAQHN